MVKLQIIFTNGHEMNIQEVKSRRIFKISNTFPITIREGQKITCHVRDGMENDMHGEYKHMNNRKIMFCKILFFIRGNLIMYI